MKTNVSLTLSLLIVLAGAGPCRDSKLDSDFSKYTVNLTEVAKKTGEDELKGSGRLLTRGIHALRHESDGEKRFPAYIGLMSGVSFLNSNPMLPPLTAPACRPLDSVGSVGQDVQKVVNLLADKSSKYHNIVLVGQPGVDTDIRVDVLADRFAHCADVPDDYKGRSIIAVDFGKLKADAGNKLFSPDEYIKHFVKPILDEFGSKNAVFYVSNIDDMAYIGPESSNGHREGLELRRLLKTFVDYNADVIFASSPASYRTLFAGVSASKGMSAQVKRIILADISTRELIGYLEDVARVEGSVNKVLVSDGVSETIARLSQAFVPGMAAQPDKPKPGVLAVSMQVLSEVIDDAKSNKGVASQDFATEQIALITHVDFDRVRNSSVLTKDSAGRYTWSNADLDSIAELATDFFHDEKKTDYLAKEIEKRLGNQFAKVLSVLGDTKKALGLLHGNPSAKTIADGLTELGKKLVEVQEKVDKGNIKLDLGIIKALQLTEEHLKTVEEAIQRGNDKLAGAIKDGLEGIATGLLAMESAIAAGNDYLKNNIQVAIDVLGANLDDISSSVEVSNDFANDTIKAINGLKSDLNTIKKRFRPGGDIGKEVAALRSTIDTQMLAKLLELKTRFASGGEYAAQVNALQALATATSNGGLAALVRRLNASAATRGDVAQGIEDINNGINTNVIPVLVSLRQSLTLGQRGIADQVDVLRLANIELGNRMTTLLGVLSVDSAGNLAGNANTALAGVETALNTQVLNVLTALQNQLTQGDRGIVGQVDALSRANTALGGRLTTLLSVLTVDGAGNLSGSAPAALASVSTALNTQVLNVLTALQTSLTRGDRGIAGQVDALNRANTALSGRLTSLLSVLTVDGAGNLAGSAPAALTGVSTAVNTQVLNVLTALQTSLTQGDRGIAGQVDALNRANTALGSRLTALLRVLTVDSSGALAGSATTALAGVESAVNNQVLNVLTSLQTSLTQGDRGVAGQVDALNRANTALGNRLTALLRVLNVDGSGALTGSATTALAGVESAVNNQVLNVLASLQASLTQGDRGVAGQVDALNRASTALGGRLTTLLSVLSVDGSGNLAGSAITALAGVENAMNSQVLTVLTSLRNELTQGNRGVAGQIDALTRANTALGGRLGTLLGVLSVDSAGNLIGTVNTALVAVEQKIRDQEQLLRDAGI